MIVSSRKRTPALLAADGTLIASIHRRGGGKVPIRWRPYWSTRADRMGAPVPPECSSLEAARSFVRLWAQAAGIGELIDGTAEGV